MRMLGKVSYMGLDTLFFLNQGGGNVTNEQCKFDILFRCQMGWSLACSQKLTELSETQPIQVKSLRFSCILYNCVCRSEFEIHYNIQLFVIVFDLGRCVCSDPVPAPARLDRGLVPRAEGEGDRVPREQERFPAAVGRRVP